MLFRLYELSTVSRQIKLLSTADFTAKEPPLIAFHSLPFAVSTEAVGNIISFLGMQPCERSDKVPENKNSHVLFLAGESLRDDFTRTEAFRSVSSNMQNERAPVNFTLFGSQVCSEAIMTHWSGLAWLWPTASPCKLQCAALRRRLSTLFWRLWAENALLQTCSSTVESQLSFVYFK